MSTGSDGCHHSTGLDRSQHQYLRQGTHFLMIDSVVIKRKGGCIRIEIVAVFILERRWAMLSDFQARPVPRNARTGVRQCQQRGQVSMSITTALLGRGSTLLQTLHSWSMSARKLPASGPRHSAAWTATRPAPQDPQSHSGLLLRSDISTG